VNVGDLLEAKVECGKITLTPKTVVGRRIAERIEDFKAGRRHGPFESHTEFIASLHRGAKKLTSKKSEVR
jgi:hypothetical protein